MFPFNPYRPRVLRFVSSVTSVGAAFVSSLAGCGDHAGGDRGGTGGAPFGGPFPASGGSAGVAGVAPVQTGGVAPVQTGGVGGSSNGASAGSSIPATFATIKLVVEGGGPIQTCSAAPCHGVNGMAPPGRPLALPSNNDQLLYTNLTSYVSTACGNLTLVVPGDPTKSALPKILSGPCGKTPRMPYMCTQQDGNCIPDEYIAAITRWIAAGAPRQ